jgi:phospholipase A-2-activating protein
MVPEAYMWQAGQWVKIGDVITEAGPAGSKKEPQYYPGDAYFEAGNYDHIFDVDDDSGVPKIIPYNDGGNPL